MADYAISILKDDETLAGFKQRAYEQACRFDIDKIVPRYEEMYERVLLPA
jgi:hypothetical protein